MGLQTEEQWAFYGGVIAFGILAIVYRAIGRPVCAKNTRTSEASFFNYLMLMIACFVLCCGYLAVGLGQGYWWATVPNTNLALYVAHAVAFTLVTAGFIGLATVDQASSTKYLFGGALCVLLNHGLIIVATLMKGHKDFGNYAFAIVSSGALVLHACLLFESGCTYLWEKGLHLFVFVARLGVVWILSQAATEVFETRTTFVIVYFFVDLITILFHMIYHQIRGSTYVSGKFIQPIETKLIAGSKTHKR